MHSRLAHHPPEAASSALSGVVACAIILGAICQAQPAAAGTAVAFLSAERSEGYQASRVYAGRAVAGRASELGFKFGGEVALLEVDLGDRVAAGDLLAKLDTASLEARLSQTRADVSLAVANLMALEAETQLARQTEARFKSLRESGHTSKQIYDEQRLTLRAKEAQLSVAEASLARAKAARQAAEIDLDDAHIFAPFGGVVQARHLDEGTQVGPGTPVLRLVEIGNKEAHVGIPATMIHRLEPGTEYTMRWGDSRFPATLSTLLPEIDDASRTLTAVFELGDAPVPIGAVVELELDSRIASAGYWLPLTALTESDRGLWGVFVINGAMEVERRLVEIIHTEAERAYVRGTLSPGDKIVRTGVQRIVPGQRVQLADDPA